MILFRNIRDTEDMYYYGLLFIDLLFNIHMRWKQGIWFFVANVGRESLYGNRNERKRRRHEGNIFSITQKLQNVLCWQKHVYLTRKIQSKHKYFVTNAHPSILCPRARQTADHMQSKERWVIVCDYSKNQSCSLSIQAEPRLLFSCDRNSSVCRYIIKFSSHTKAKCESRRGVVMLQTSVNTLPIAF